MILFQLNITLNNENVKPGESALIYLNSTPNSTVYLSAVDLSVKQLKKEDFFGRKEATLSFIANAIQTNQEKLGKPRYPNFADSNALILTNAIKGEPDCSTSRLSSNSSDEIVFLDQDETFEVSTSEPRYYFPETWIFESFKVDRSGQFQVRNKVPDTITSWMIDGFSMNPNVGLGFSLQHKLKVFKPFFIQLELPHSIRFGEIAKIEVFVFNYIPSPDKSIKVNVAVVHNQTEFEVVQVEEDCSVTRLQREMHNKKLSVKANSVTSTIFYIRPIAAGHINLKFKANSMLAGDEVQKFLFVKPEGISHHNQKSLLVDTRDRRYFSHYFELNMDQSVLNDSVNIGASAIGNVMGTSKNIDGNVPSSNTLAKFVANIFNFEYLLAINELPKPKRQELVSNLETGYQDLIKYKVADGSFGKIWFTALAVKCLGHVKHWLEVDDSYIADALTYLNKKQTDKGSFMEDVEKDDNLALTAYTTIAFLENEIYRDRFKDTIKASVDFIYKNFMKIGNNYELALSAYALALNRDAHINSFLDALKGNAIIEGDEMHWDMELKGPRNQQLTVVSDKIVMASYALLANLKGGRSEDALKILKWLVSHGGSTGFLSIKDAAVAVQALTEAAKMYHSKNIDLLINLEDSKNNNQNIIIKDKNAETVQTIQIPSYTDSVSVMASGTGLASLDVWWKYIAAAEISKRFEVSAKVENLNSQGLIKLHICTSFIPDVNKTQADQTIMEVEMLSGYTFDPDSKELLKAANIKVRK